jgi:hypothetical protein
VDLDIVDQLLIRFSTYIRHILEKNENIMAQYIGYFQVSRKVIIQLGENYYTVFSLCLVQPGN